MDAKKIISQIEIIKFDLYNEASRLSFEKGQELKFDAVCEVILNLGNAVESLKRIE